MVTPPRRKQELPPTAGLPPELADLWPRPDALTRTIALQLKVPEPLLTCSGSAALMLALATMRAQRPGRLRVVVPAYTCPLVPLAVQQAGLEPLVCDVRPGGFDFDPQALRSACDERVLAVIPTHLGGQVADVADAMAVAHAVGAFVIEDAAQALGAQYNGSSVGLTGDAGFFSLAAGKGLSIYEGGLLVARDPVLRAALAETAAKIVPQRWGWECRRSAELLAYTMLYRPYGLRWAYGAPLRRALRRGDPVMAVGDDFALPLPQHRVGRWRRGVGTCAAQRLPNFLRDGTERAQRHLAQLKEIEGVQVVGSAPGGDGIWPFFMLLLPSQLRRDRALARLWSSGLGVSRLFIHALPDYAYLGQLATVGSVDAARDFAARSLTIGNSPWMTQADLDAVVQRLAV